MYGEGGAEEVVGEAVAGACERPVTRDECSSSARSTRTTPRARGTVAACERSLRPARPRPPRLLSAALARQRAAQGDRRRVREAARSRQASATGASATSTSTTWSSSSSVPGGERCATNQVLLLAERARRRALRSCRGCNSTAWRRWPIRRSTRASWRATPRSRAWRASARRHAGPARARLARRPARRDGDSEGGERRAPAREPRARWRSTLSGPPTSAELDAAFPPPARAKRPLAMI